MGSKSRVDEKNGFNIAKVTAVSLIGSVLFFSFTALFSLFALKNNISSSTYMPSGLIAGAVSAFIAGFITVRPIKQKGALYGALSGFFQALICSIVLFIVNGGSAGTGIFILSGLMILLSATGGISAVNLKIKKKY